MMAHLNQTHLPQQRLFLALFSAFLLCSTVWFSPLGQAKETPPTTPVTSPITTPLTTSAPSRWLQTNQIVTDQHVVPRYNRFANSSAHLQESAELFCKTVDKTHFNALQQAFHKAMDDWMSVQHIRFGPVDLLLRYNRLALWPDKHNTGTKQLRQLLVQQPRKILKPDQFALSSVAVQGFSALERLLFPKTLRLTDFSEKGQATYRCDVIKAITQNIARIAAGTFEDWQPGSVNFREVILSAEHGNDYYDSSEEVTARLLNNLYTQLQAVVDQKLLRPLENYQLNRAESWRSRRSLRNILLNLQAIEELYKVGFSPLVSTPSVNTDIQRAFQKTIDSVQSIQKPMYDIPKESPEYRALLQTLENCRELKRLIGTQLPAAIGLTLGFNSLDGD